MGVTAVKKSILLLAAVGAAGVVGTACTATTSGRSMAPVCSATRFDPLILTAQAVPTAERIPCIVSYPAGWKLGEVDVRRGKSSFSLTSDRAEGDALQVTLEAACDTRGSMEVRTDELGTVRHDRRFSDDEGFREVRTYSFPGGCVTYRFGFSHQPELGTEASMAVGFITRAQVDADARHLTGGRMHL